MTISIVLNILVIYWVPINPYVILLKNVLIYSTLMQYILTPAFPPSPSQFPLNYFSKSLEQVISFYKTKIQT